MFYKEDNDTTVIADGFPLLNALKEVHLLLAQGAHNQFGDLPWTARVGDADAAVAAGAAGDARLPAEPRRWCPTPRPGWPQVDTMKTLQGWSDVTVTHFRDLGVYGEQILLSIRYGDWIDVNDENQAKNWARYWRPEIQGYIHAYRAVTGVDLTNPDTRRLHHAGRAPAESGWRCSGRGEMRPVLDFTSALYLGLRHPSSSLRPWSGLTTGKPAVLEPPRGRRRHCRASLPRWWAASARRRFPRRCICSGTCSECSHVTE